MSFGWLHCLSVGPPSRTPTPDLLRLRYISRLAKFCRRHCVVGLVRLLAGHCPVPGAHLRNQPCRVDMFNCCGYVAATAPLMAISAYY